MGDIISPVLLFVNFILVLACLVWVICIYAQMKRFRQKLKIEQTLA